MRDAVDSDLCGMPAAGRPVEAECKRNTSGKVCPETPHGSLKAESVQERYKQHRLARGEWYNMPRFGVNGFTIGHWRKLLQKKGKYIVPTYTDNDIISKTFVSDKTDA